MSYDKHGKGVVAALLVHADLIKKVIKFLQKIPVRGL